MTAIDTPPSPSRPPQRRRALDVTSADPDDSHDVLDRTVADITARVAAKLPHVAPNDIERLVRTELRRRETDRVRTYTNVLTLRAVIDRLARASRSEEAIY